MNKIIFTIAIAVALSTGISADASEGQKGTVDYSIIRSVGAVCGSGLSADVKGDLDARIIRIFGGISASGNTRFDLGQVKDLIDQIPETDGKRAVYATYVNCVTQVVSSIVGTAIESDTTPVITDLLIPDPLIVIKNGQKFSMKIGDTRAITRDSLTFTITDIKKPGALLYRVSDIGQDSAKSYIGGVKRAQVITLAKGCFINPYQINTDEDNEYVSFTTDCK